MEWMDAAVAMGAKRRQLLLLALVWAACAAWLTGALIASPRGPYGVPLPRIVHAVLDKPAWRKRVLIIGDVHGCLDELIDLLAAARYQPASDEVVLVGDLVDKGPHSALLVRWVRERGFVSVRGNHDELLLAQLARLGSAELGAPAPPPPPPLSFAAPAPSEAQPEEEGGGGAGLDGAGLDGGSAAARAAPGPERAPAPSASRLGWPLRGDDGLQLLAPALPPPALDSDADEAFAPEAAAPAAAAPGAAPSARSEGPGHRARPAPGSAGPGPAGGGGEAGAALSEAALYAAQLSAEDVVFLRELPFSLRIPDLGLLVVHAGVLPGVPLLSQRLEDLFTIRRVRVPTPGQDERPAVAYARDGPDAHSVPWARLYRGESGHAVFGHDARRGWQKEPSATGIDTGCVYGGRLSALVLPGFEVVSVRARKAYAFKGGSFYHNRSRFPTPEPYAGRLPSHSLGDYEALYRNGRATQTLADRLAPKR